MGNYLDGCAKETCGHCGLKRTIEGHDGCIGTLKNVMNSCCGHGETKMAYVQFNHENYSEEPNKIRLSGEKALNYIKANGKYIDILNIIYANSEVNSNSKIVINENGFHKLAEDLNTLFFKNDLFIGVDG